MQIAKCLLWQQLNLCKYFYKTRPTYMVIVDGLYVDDGDDTRSVLVVQVYRVSLGDTGLTSCHGAHHSLTKHRQTLECSLQWQDAIWGICVAINVQKSTKTTQKCKLFFFVFYKNGFSSVQTKSL